MLCWGDFRLKKKLERGGGAKVTVAALIYGKGGAAKAARAGTLMLRLSVKSGGSVDMGYVLA